MTPKKLESYKLTDKKKKEEIKTIQVNGCATTNPKLICENLNDFFINVGPELASKIPNQQVNEATKKTSCNSIFLLPTTKEEVAKAIEDLDPNKATGNDDVVDRSVKQCKSETVV